MNELNPAYGLGADAGWSEVEGSDGREQDKRKRERRHVLLKQQQSPNAMIHPSTNSPDIPEKMTASPYGAVQLIAGNNPGEKRIAGEEALYTEVNETEMMEHSDYQIEVKDEGTEMLLWKN